ncbi:pyridoxal phosphate-dependent decarboxylase family protein [Cellulosimicrobium cellulans]|uniref:pyridoxal phosphate-dependent decarboxylase family protein n=1 Tax=Cellulosimicrobium cellulans TaxID=1710 RepID=UPI002406F4FD|nr:aminotransferase class V-fold PLP-dependent enzyme [Cellulosimicrobium cellulans]MDF9875670.1 sphinganine-1-phosphate aldolase [Cellulosimicrobium cellulans]
MTTPRPTEPATDASSERPGAPPTGDVPLRTDGILDRLATLRAADAPTHGGRVLSYVYDPGLAELDELAAAAARAVQPVNGLDPTTFTSVAVMESELVAFARAMLRGAPTGPAAVVGSVTSGGTESCLLAVKIARDAARAARPEVRPRVLAPVSVHAAFRKAAQYLDVDLTLVPVDPATGTLAAADLVAELDDDVALVVVSAPSYPHGVVDPVAEVAAAAAAHGVPVHVDACVGGWVLPFWEGAGGEQVPAFDFSVPGVTSISADVHKYGYAPKGTSVLLVRGRDRQRRQFFATTGWPGYPVVNPTTSGSRSAAPLAAAWAVSQALGVPGYTALTARCVRATRALHEAIDGIDGLRVVGHPTGPLVAVACDESVPATRRVDPHQWADAVRSLGWVLQPQPGLAQDDGTHLPHTTHLTVTPVTEAGLDDLVAALVQGADAVRGEPRPDVSAVLGALAGAFTASPGDAPAEPTADAVWEALLAALAADGGEPRGTTRSVLPDRLAPLMAVMEVLPAAVAERALVEIVARVAEPPAGIGTP